MDEEVGQIPGYQKGIEDLEDDRRTENVRFELRLAAQDKDGEPGKDEASRDERGKWLSRNRLNQQDTARSSLVPGAEGGRLGEF